MLHIEPIKIGTRLYMTPRRLRSQCGTISCSRNTPARQQVLVANSHGRIRREYSYPCWHYEPANHRPNTCSPLKKERPHMTNKLLG